MVFALTKLRGSEAGENVETSQSDLVGGVRSESLATLHQKHFLISCVFHKQTNKAENNNEQ
jgi:hypothetical protein